MYAWVFLVDKRGYPMLKSSTSKISVEPPGIGPDERLPRKLILQEGQEEVLNEAGEVITPAVAEVTLNYGNFLQQTFDFLIIALSIFIMIKAITKLTEKKKKEEAPAPAAPAPAPEPSAEEKLLTEIRDLLKEKK